MQKSHKQTRKMRKHPGGGQAKESKRVGTIEKGLVFNPNGSVPMPQASLYVPDNQVYRVCQTYTQGGAIVTNNSTPTFTSFYTQFSQIDQYSALASVFDQYLIRKVEWWIIPRLTDGTSASYNPGLIKSVIDYDDANTITSMGALDDYSNCITSSGLCGHYRSYRPHIAVAAYGGSFNTYKNEPSNWIDTSSSGTQHFGLKVGILATGNAQTYDVVSRFLVELRNTR